MNKKNKENPELELLIERKITFLKEIIQKTILNIHKNKLLEIVNLSDVNGCIHHLSNLNKKLNNIATDTSSDDKINTLQLVTNEISLTFRAYGTDSFEDLLLVCFGNAPTTNYVISDMDKQKFELLKRYFHPIGYTIMKKSANSKQIKPEAELNENSKNLECIDVPMKTKPFHLKVFGIQTIVHNIQENKSIIITGIVDDIMLEMLDNDFIKLKHQTIINDVPNSPGFDLNTFERFLNTLNLKDYLISEPHNIYTKYAGCLSNLNTFNQKPISQIIKEFISSDLKIKRNTIIQLLIKEGNHDNQYLAYLLYDLLTNDLNGNIDSHDQTLIFDSFPWAIKQYFKEAMKNTTNYTNELLNFDINKIPLEQQICLLKVNDNVKEKAMQKLKEVKAKSEDSGSKARQYLDGLLKIPFGIYKKEPILYTMDVIKQKYISMMRKYNLPIKDNYTSLEIVKSLKELNMIASSQKITYALPEDLLNEFTKDELKNVVSLLNSYEGVYQLNMPKLKLSNRTMKERKQDIIKWIKQLQTNKTVFNQLFDSLDDENMIDLFTSFKETSIVSKADIQEIENKYSEINTYMTNIKTVLDGAIHGHSKAKTQIERIIGQWINGKQDGYCFGFEGFAGIGKTTLAKKGLANCLKDENGIPRPFAMIQMGGDSNGSSLHGHNYTYVGSTWGSIVQILIDKKCMNPIIFIDEVDKISKTEQGREIIGILTHLLDPAQNDCFQDKYFSGIELDLSKALFILSYNDASLIDKIMLDRIHRIKFSALSLEEKIVISNKYLLPEIYEKMGLSNMIYLSDEVLKYIINEYTLEPGVRKLKEILFEIVAEINLDVLKKLNSDYDIPINITIHDIKNKYFKDKIEVKRTKIHNESKIGIINGLWANEYGQSGVIPIQTAWRPCDKYSFMELNLTGMQGEVMKESMKVASTLAWKLTESDQQEKITANYMGNGIHIHCPEGSTPKDGPSAGTAITVTLYSLLNERKIKNNIAITGEITLDGNVTEIGGLDLKILGGIKAGVTEFIYPKDNQKDYEKFIDKYNNDELTKGIIFHSVENINEVLELVFE